MIQINIGDHSGSEKGYPFLPIPARWLPNVRWARSHAIRVAQGNPNANRYFRSLSSKQISLSSLLANRRIWINYYDKPQYFAFTRNNNDLWLCDLALKRGKWVTLAALIHELAHIAGAPGDMQACTDFVPRCHAAERAVLECGLGHRSELSSGKDDWRTPYNPNVYG